VSDGHTHKDLAFVTVEAMQKFLDSSVEDFWQLFDATLNKIQAGFSEEIEKELGRAQKEKEMLSEQKAEALGELAGTEDEVINGNYCTRCYSKWVVKN